MKTQKTEPPERPPVENLYELVEGATDDNPLYIEVAVGADGRVVVFHDKPFREALSWYEYNTNTNHLDFVLEDGEMRRIGIPLKPEIGKHMHNTHQVLTVWMNDETGDAVSGQYVPLILHHN